MKRIMALLLTVSLLLGVPVVGVSAAEETKIALQQLSLGDDLCMEFFVATENANAQIEVAVLGDTQSYAVSGMTPNEDGYYVVAADLAAAQMTDTVTVSVKDGDSVLAEGSYSVRAYCEAILNGSYTDETKQMVKEVLNYGAAAQQYFQYNTDNLANDGYVMEPTVELPDANGDMSVDGAVSGLAFYGASLVFESKVAVRYYFTAVGDVEGYTFTANDTQHTAHHKQENLYYVEVADINPQQMDQVVALEASDGLDALTVCYSPLHYMVRMTAKETTSDSLKTLLKAMYSYHCAAKKFVGIEQAAVPITIVNHEIIGSWADDRVWDNGTNNTTLGPQLSYDGDMSTSWQPIANTGYTGEPGMIYVLDGYYDLKNMDLTFNTPKYYITVYTSTDGSEFTELYKVNSGNLGNAYTDNAISVEVQASAVHYIKLVFNGRSDSAPWVGLLEVAFAGVAVPKPEAPKPDGQEKAVAVTGHEIIGSWSDDRVWDDGSNDSSTGPHLSYDGNPATSWQPIANTGYTNEPGMVYTLDSYYYLTKLELLFNTAKYYFTVYGSADGINFSELFRVDSGNLNTAYTDNTISIDLNTSAVKYIKLVFNGRSDNGPWVGLMEISASGVETTKPEETLENVKANIIANSVLGEWTFDRVGNTTIGPEMSYDAADNTKWNPQPVSYTGEEGILYTLDAFYDLQQFTLTFAADEKMYFQLYTSSDDVTYKLVKEVTAADTALYSSGVITVNDTSAEAVKYIKLIFTGKRNNNGWINFYDITVTGLKEKQKMTVSGAFSSNMVLQRNQPISVWGWAETGETVTGTFAGKTVTATADENNKWTLVFPAQSANTTGQTMTISGSENQISFGNILIGDVYIVNGQSNAELSVGRTAAHLDADDRNAVNEQFRYDNNIRLFHQVKKYTVDNPQYWDVPQNNIIDPACSWKIAAVNDDFWDFSALGMYFAKNVRQSLSEDIPIGLIQTACGGAFLDELMPNELNQQFGYTGKHTVNVGGYYNAMMHPLVGLPIAGMLFFQGESNNYMMADTYARDLAAYITELRTRWGQDFHFYNVQLSSYGQYQVDNKIWPYLYTVRNQQYQLLESLDNYYLSVSMDIGYAGEVDQGTNLQDYMHPKNKKELGARVAKQALAVYYNALEIGEDSFSPVPAGVQWNTDGILISFENADTLSLATGENLVGFQCVINEEVVDVAAQIVNGNQVKLDVDASVVSEIRYAMIYLGYAENANLVNGSGLPAPTFAISNPGEYTTTKTVIKTSAVSDTGWKSLGVAAALPCHSYDGNMETYWNPQIASFAQKPTITYYLNKACVLDGMTLTFLNRQQYITVYTSTDGSTFTEAAQITAENYTDYVCTLDGLNITGVVAIRLEFTGSSNNTLWVNFHEIELDAQPIN